MLGSEDPEGRSRRRTVASLLVFANELERAGRISKASKSLLKELIVHENEKVMKIGDGLAKADGQQDLALDVLDDMIKHRASKSHEELFEACSLEQAHLLSQQDTEALVQGSDTKLRCAATQHLGPERQIPIVAHALRNAMNMSFQGGKSGFEQWHHERGSANRGSLRTVCNCLVTYASELLSHTPSMRFLSPRGVVGGPGRRDTHGFSPARRPAFRQGVSSSNISIDFVLLRQAYDTCNGGILKWLITKKSLVYGEIDFCSFYDVIKVAVEGMDTTANNFQHRKRQREACVADGGGEGESKQRAQCEDAGSAESSPEKEGCHESGEENKAPVDRSLMSSRCWEDEAAAMDGGGEGGRGGGGFKFYDLGSGSGKAVFAAVLAVDFRCAVGIEVLTGVHRASTRVLKRYHRLVEPVLCCPALIKLYNGSFLAPEFDWTDGDVVFANSTCFAEDTMMAIAERAALLRPGARIVTFTTALKTPWLRVLLKRRYQMSWGPATVFVHQKLSPEEYAVRIAESTPFDEDQGLITEKVLAPILTPTSSPSVRGRDCSGSGSGFDAGGENGEDSAYDEGKEGGGEYMYCSSPRRPLCC